MENGAEHYAKRQGMGIAELAGLLYWFTGVGLPIRRPLCAGCLSGIGR